MTDVFESVRSWNGEALAVKVEKAAVAVKKVMARAQVPVREAIAAGNATR